MEPQTTQENWVSKVEEMFQEAEDWAHIRQILVNVNYYLGNQWIGWNREMRQVVELPRENNVERITLNKIRPRVLTLLSKHTKNKLKFDVIPASREQRDLDAAKAANKYLQFMWQELDLTSKTKEIFLNNLVKGWCMVKVWFDATNGQEITPQEGEPGWEPNMGPVFTGEICMRVCDPLTLFIDPSATTEEEIRWVIEKKARDIDDIEAEYGVRVTPDVNMDYLNNYDVTNTDTVGSGKSTRFENMAFVYEMWYRPCKKYPGGMKVTVAGGQELDYSEDAGEIPYFLFGYIPIPGTVRFDSLIKDMIPVQRGINVKRSMVATHARRIGNAMWLVPLGSGVDEDELSNETAGFVHYTPIGNMKPERAQAPDIPSFYDRDLQFDNVDLDDMSGSREVSQGRMPKGLDTLGGLEIMVEQENEKLTVAAQNYEEGMKKAMRRVLVLMKKHYTEERQGRILGEDNEVEVISFLGSDLDGSEDVIVVQGSSLPEMKAAQQERIMLMWKSNAIVKKNGMPDHQALLRLMGLGDSSDLFEQTELDENKAKLENKFFMDMVQNPEVFGQYKQYQMQKQAADMLNQRLQQAAAAGQAVTQDMFEQPPTPPPGIPRVRDFQDHEVHLYQHNLFRKSSEYEALPPEIQQMIDAHCDETGQALMAPMMEQQAQQQAMMQQQQQGEQQAQQQAGRQQQQADQQKQQADQQNQRRQQQVDQQNQSQQFARDRQAKREDHVMALQKEAVKAELNPKGGNA